MSDENTTHVNEGTAQADAPAHAASNDADAPTPPELLGRALAEAQQRAEENMAGWQRERADFANYKRRVERERADYQQASVFDVVQQVLPIADDFHLSVRNIPDQLRDEPWVRGTALIAKKFEKLLDGFGLTPIDVAGVPFDPSQHNAVSRDASDTVPSGYVIETLQVGYKLGDRVVRPALVRVAE